MYDILTVYHGSTEVVSHPKVDVGRPNLDFGPSLIFDAYNKEWLEFVTKSRLGERPWIGYDYIEGGVADDRVVNTIRLYMGGYISDEDALNRLKYFKPTNQICLLNQKITDRYLTFVESRSLKNYE